MKYQVQDLHNKIVAVMQVRGFTAEDAESVAKPIMWAETHGNNQGLLKLIGEPGLLKDLSSAPVSTQKESASTALLDGGNHNAMIALQAGVAVAIQKLKTSGVVAVGIRNTHSSSGALNYYIEQLSGAGYVAIIMARTTPAVAPFNTLQKVFGPDPFAYSVPTLASPLSFDMATSAIAWYGLMKAASAGETIDADRVINDIGEPITDPKQAMEQGMITSFGGHKGSALGMLVELLGGAFVGADSGTPDSEWGHLIIALDPEAMSGAQQFKQKTSQLIDILRAAKTKDGKPVHLPGDAGKAFYNKVTADGYIDVPQTTLDSLGWK